jgi:hypothetical protein
MNCKLSIILLALPLALVAQGRHEVSVGVGVAGTTFNYKPASGSGFFGGIDLGGAAGVDYAYYLDEHWGIGAGVNFSMYSGKYKSSARTGIFGDIMDSEGDKFNLKYTLTDYSETQRIYMLTFPVMLHYQREMLYTALGVKVGFPFYAAYSAGASKLNVVVDFPYLSSLAEPTYKGFGEFDAVKGNDVLSLAWKTALFISAEVGLKWDLGVTTLYTGLWADYAINNIYQTPYGMKDHVEYDKGRDYLLNPYSPNSVFFSRANTADAGAIIDKINPLAVGIKIAFTLFQSESDYDNSSERRAAAGSSASSGGSDGGGGTAVRRSQWGNAATAIPPPPSTKEGNANICLNIVGASVKTDNITVASGGRVSFSEATIEYLNEKVEHLKLHNNTSVIIGGQNCCMCKGPVAPDLELARIETAKKYLIQHGIEAHRISIRVNNPANFTAPDITYSIDNAVNVNTPAATDTTTNATTPTVRRTRPVRSTIRSRTTSGDAPPGETDASQSDIRPTPIDTTSTNTQPVASTKDRFEVEKTESSSTVKLDEYLTNGIY